MRLQQLLDRPDRFQPRPTVPLPLDLRNPEPVEDAAMEPWCDDYMARLAITTIRTLDRKGKLSTRTSGTDRAILGALCSIARDQNCWCIKASEVDIAARASIANTDTVARAIQRLEAAFYLSRSPGMFRYNANKYSVAIEKLEQRDTSGARPVALSYVTDMESIATGNLSNEAYRAKNVGKTAADLYAYLAAHPDLTMADLARVKGRHPSTVKSNLERLRALNMVEEEGGRWRVYVRAVRDDDDLHKVVELACRRRSVARLVREEQRAAEEAAQQAQNQRDQVLYDALQAGVYERLAANSSPVRDA